ncbi:hypothetical protein BKA61DRAFT_741568 [Leptodontidium sp. MPI-SDFR-AT-0119]|nr:hypothetical protein BKA61DRAFT_741568 [Leptodontidium sp. MPI-SDFR-AT-0119]
MTSETSSVGFGRHDASLQGHDNSPEDVNDRTTFNLISRNRGSWTEGEISIEALCAQQGPLPEALLIFLPSEDTFSQEDCNSLTNRFKIPSSFWSRLAKDASGFVGSNVTQDTSANLESYGLLFRFLVKELHEPGQFIYNASRADYVWHRLGFFTSWTPSSSTIFICFDLPTGLQDSLKAALLHTVLVGEIVALYDQALWSSREQVRNFEKNRALLDNPQPNYETMHELARHTIHSSEMLSMGLEIISSLLQEYEILFEENRLLLEANEL